MGEHQERWRRSIPGEPTRGVAPGSPPPRVPAGPAASLLSASADGPEWHRRVHPAPASHRSRLPRGNRGCRSLRPHYRPGRHSRARVPPSNHAPHPLVSCHLYDAGEIARCRVLTLGETSRVQPCYDALRPPPPDGRSPASRSAGAPVRDAGRGLLSSSSPTRRPPTARYRRNSAASARNGAVTKTTTASSMRRMIPMACLYPLAERSGGAGSPQPTLVWRTAGGSGYSSSALPPNKEGGGVDAVTSWPRRSVSRSRFPGSSCSSSWSCCPVAHLLKWTARVAARTPGAPAETEASNGLGAIREAARGSCHKLFAT